MSLDLFDYQLPDELIAKSPAHPRDHSKLMVIDKQTGEISHHIFKDLVEILKPRDVLVFNQTKVFPARLFGKKTTGGKVEVLLLAQLSGSSWEAISKPGLKAGQKIIFDQDLQAEVGSVDTDGVTRLEFNLSGGKLLEKINKLGAVPLPPYIKNSQSQDRLREEYQTVYAKDLGSAAAPTAGLHFTPELLGKLQQKGIELEFITLHVGLGTFRPVSETQIEQGVLHQEKYWLGEETARRLNQAKKIGRRIIAVGTTSTRTLESRAEFDPQSGKPKLLAGNGETNLFIQPPYQFKFVDGMITNFHLPKSSLLMLVSALVSYPNTDHQFKDFSSSIVGKAYQQAIKDHYRFYSFGDATLLI